MSQAEFERNLAGKLEDLEFIEDVLPLMGPDVEYDASRAAVLVQERLVSRLPGDPWKGVA